MHSKTIKESNLEQYEAKLRAFMSKAGNRDYIKPDEFHSLQRESMGMDTILKDCDYFITKEGVEIKLATTKYTGRKIKTLVSKVPSIPNPLPPTAFDGYTVVSSQSFDSYIRTKTAIPTHETAHWVQGPFDGVCIKEDGFWFARWGEFSNGVKVVSFAMMPTQRYTEDPEKQFNQSKAVEHDSMQSLRDAKYDLISMSKFDGFASEGFFRSGPFAYTSMGDHDGKKEIVTKHCGRLKSGVVVAAFDRKPFVEPELIDDWDDENDDDEEEGPMIREKPSKTLRHIQPDTYFRVADMPTEKLVVMVRAPEQSFYVKPAGVSAESIAVIVAIDGRKYDGKGYAPFKVGSVRWLTLDREVESLELTERPEFTVDD